jgi:hypothetical protein
VLSFAAYERAALLACHASEYVHLMWKHSDVGEKSNLLAGYVETKAVDKGNGAAPTIIDFSRFSTFSSGVALKQRRPYCLKKHS